MAELQVDEPIKVKKNIHQIVNSAQRAAALVRQILTLSRQSEYKKKPLKVFLLLKEALDLLKGVKIEHPDHVWSTDITYIKIGNGFIYLTVVIDWYSRYVLSWQLSNSLENTFCIEVLEDALAISKPVAV